MVYKAGNLAPSSPDVQEPRCDAAEVSCKKSTSVMVLDAAVWGQWWP